MPIHDWTRVEAGIFHAFHHDWITEIARILNQALLPSEYYALPEIIACAFGPDVLKMQELHSDGDQELELSETGEGGVLLAAPKLKPIAESDLAYYRKKQKNVAIRHVSGDRIVAVVEIVSPGNKSGQMALQAFVAKAAELLDRQIHLLILDLHPPGKRDPNGIHGAIWEEISGKDYEAPADKPLTLAAYEASLTVRAYVAHAAVGDELTEMPLFLEPERAVHVPLEQTYHDSFVEVPRRWRRVLEPANS